jgi:outer membrane protein assembly factor BamB
MFRRRSFWPLLLGLPLAAGADWPQFRGPDNASVAEGSRLPATWNEGLHIAWRIELPGRGPSGPIVVGDRVFLTATTGVRHDRLLVLCYDARSGQARWQRQFWATGRIATHDSITGAAPTPASDGQRVFAFFSSNDLICLDLDGNLQWYRGLSYERPQSGSDVGMASSPALVDGAVVVQVESQGESFAAGIDADTGEDLWRLPRRNLANWSSPIVLPGQGGRRTAVLLQSPGGLSAHDPRTGQLLWALDSGCASTSSSVFRDNLLLVPMNGLTALRLSDSDQTPEVLWDSRRMSPGAPSPVIHEDRIYALSGAILKCGDLATGELIWQVRLEGTHWATPVIADQRIYCVNYDGKANVIRLDREQGEIVGQAEFGELIHASPAISGNAMYVRSDKYLWKVSEP